VPDEVWKSSAPLGVRLLQRPRGRVRRASPAVRGPQCPARYPVFLYAGLLEHAPGMWPRRVIVADDGDPDLAAQAVLDHLDENKKSAQA
jgi:error-prone DNA polymerase